jgi:hypothetical protein
MISQLGIMISQAGIEISSLQEAWTPVRRGEGVPVVEPLANASHQQLISIGPRLASLAGSGGRNEKGEKSYRSGFHSYCAVREWGCEGSGFISDVLSSLDACEISYVLRRVEFPQGWFLDPVIRPTSQTVL